MVAKQHELTEKWDKHWEVLQQCAYTHTHTHTHRPTIFVYKQFRIYKHIYKVKEEKSFFICF